MIFAPPTFAAIAAKSLNGEPPLPATLGRQGCVVRSPNIPAAVFADGHQAPPFRRLLINPRN
jgi:hypothetical protein